MTVVEALRSFVDAVESKIDPNTQLDPADEIKVRALVGLIRESKSTEDAQLVCSASFDLFRGQSGGAS